MPSQLMSAVIVPLVKCKTGDLSDVDNYRAITLSNSVSKIIETLLFDIIETVDDIDDYQFGFRKMFPPLCVLMCSRVQLTITAGMAVTFFVVLLILRKPLIELITGYYSVYL